MGSSHRVDRVQRERREDTLMHQTQSAGTLHLATPTLPGSARTAGSPFLSHLHARWESRTMKVENFPIGSHIQTAIQCQGRSLFISLAPKTSVTRDCRRRARCQAHWKN